MQYYIVAAELHIGAFPHVPPYNRSESYCSRSTVDNDDNDHKHKIFVVAGVAGAATILLCVVVAVIFFIRLANCSHFASA